MLEALPKAEVSPSAVMDLDATSIERALGVSYDTKEDVFTFVITLKDGPMTKRGILRITCSLFDPLGFLIPFLLKAKLLIQELWRLELEWDEVHDENQQ